MPLDFLSIEEIKRQKVFLLLVIGASLFLLAVLWFGIFSKRRVAKTSVLPPQSEKIEMDFSVLENPALGDLTLFDEIEIPEEIGRENPFLPYGSAKK